MNPRDTGIFLSHDAVRNDLPRLIETRDDPRTTA
jgi:hypothetical protein